MIYLIGGPLKCGKTTLAKRLSKITGIPWISVDILRQIAKKYTDPSRHAELFPINTITKQMQNNNDLLYSRYSIKEIINACQKQGESCYDAIEIMTLSNAEYIIEGHQVTPELLEKLTSQHGKKKDIKGIFLTKTNREKLVQDFTKNPFPEEDWIIKGTKDRKETFPKIANMIAKYSEYFEAEAEKYRFKVLKMDNDFENQIENAIKYILSV
jgi:2-phosphoglycerate kinase